MPAGWLNLDASPVDTFGGEKSAWPGLDLTRMQRIIGFGACYLGGFVLSLLGAIFLMTGWTDIFALFFGVGAIISLVGTGFLVGFGTQFKMMFKPIRLWATIVMLISIVLLFVFAFTIPSLCILFVIINWLA